MKQNHTLRTFLCGMLSALLLCSLVTPAFASSVGKIIEVFTDVSIFVDEKRLTDANGNPINAFIHNGTTFVPVRAVSEVVGKPVQWEGSTRSVYIGKHTSTAPVAYLAEMDYFYAQYESDWIIDRLIKDNLGKDHLHSLTLWKNLDGTITYKLNGQYSRLTATYFQKYDNRATHPNNKATLTISGDGRELWRGTVGPGVDPLDVDINITGVLELTIEYPKGNNVGWVAALGDVALWT